MQRTGTVFLLSVLASLLTLGCPEKRVEKEEPAAATAADKSGADKPADEKPAADEERVDEGEEHGEEAKDEKKPARKKKTDKAPGEEKDTGGW
jgi:hypothetical protein